MSDAPFDACWDRWERADQIRQTLPGIWNEYIDTDPFDFALNSQGDGYYVMTVWQREPLPAEFALAFGEWLFHMRSTLDYVIWATATHVSGKRPPPREKILQFPVCADEKAWQGSLYRIEGLHQHQRDMLEKMQPYRNPDKNPHEWINRLAAIDRHRRPMDGTAFVAVLEPAFHVSGGLDLSLEWGEQVLVDGWADVARIKVKGWTEDTQVEFNPRSGIDPEIREWAASPFWRRIRFDDRLVIMQGRVAADIATFEYDCTGSSREAQMLTADYRRASDERRVRLPVERPARRAVKWRSAGSGHPATAEQLAGDDFPRDARDRRRNEEA